MTTLYIIRHGQTDRNLAKRLQGHTDIPLNDTGRDQASRASHVLRDIQIDHIYSSDLSRAHETAHIVQGIRDLQIITDHRLREKGFGGHEGKFFVEIEDQAMNEGVTFEDIVRQECESDEYICARIHSAMTDIVTRHPDQTIIVTTHGGAIRHRLEHQFNFRIAKGANKNTSITKVIYMDHTRYLEYANQADHLEDVSH